MIRKIHMSIRQLPVFGGLSVLLVVATTVQVFALTPLPTPEPKPGSFGLEATKRKAPPTQGASISTPGNGASFSTSPITVTGICPTDLLVQVYNNNVMVGAVMCEKGSFSVEVSLFAGVNELSAIVYDELNQAGPVSNIVTVNYTDTRFSEFGSLVTLTSAYGRRSAATGAELAWPLQLSGGLGPYALSLDWGDGSPDKLKSQSLSGPITTEHSYKKAGIYQVNIKATDVKGASAFLQVVAVASGKVDNATATGDQQGGATKKEVLWVPTVVTLAALGPVFWLGRQSQLVSLRNKMLKERDNYNKK